MKKLTAWQRIRSIRANLRKRRLEGRRPKRRTSGRKRRPVHDRKWLDRWTARGLVLSEIRPGQYSLLLPQEMNFSTDYEQTALNVLAIRRLARRTEGRKRADRLVRVDFSALTTISTPAALVLTAELSKWDDGIRRGLRPLVGDWNPAILRQFAALGFFDLFRQSPAELRSSPGSADTPVKLVRYIKGRCGEGGRARDLRRGVADIVGDEIDKWTFLRCGLDEAITNVTHHAYPDGHGYLDEDKHWYLTGSYNQESGELKIVFYDQGIGIPGSLPASAVWERLLSTMSFLPLMERMKDATMIKAAVELDRTRTGDDDRGKGLQDLLEFVRQRGDGYLSIMSARGLYKLTAVNGAETVKSEHFDNTIAGTLIIWCVNLARRNGMEA